MLPNPRTDSAQPVDLNQRRPCHSGETPSNVWGHFWPSQLREGRYWHRWEESRNADIRATVADAAKRPPA